MSENPSPPSSLHRHRRTLFPCAVCGVEKPRHAVVPLDMVRPGIVDLVRAAYPQAPAEGFICHDDLGQYRASYVGKMLAAERGELTRLEQDVIDSLARYDTLSMNVESAYSEKRTFGERLADGMATFGGSWTFILIFAAFIVVWLLANSIALATGTKGGLAFDPFPYILLNLVLSCLAALQAPVIMMSQKRQEAKDRLRSENDYRINLKAELEIRHLHEKFDHLLTRQWDRLAEIQEIQLDLMQDLAGRGK